MERCPYRDQRVISWYSCRVLSLLLLFPRSGFSPLSCMGRKCSSGCCVILRSRFIHATSNFVPLLRFMPDDGTHERHLYLIVSYVPQFLDLISFSYHHYPVAVCSASLILSCSRFYIVYAYYSSTFDPLSSCVYFPSRLFFSLFIFPLTIVLP